MSDNTAIPDNATSGAASASPRAGIYYWKCDRPSALHGTEQGSARRERPGLQQQVAAMLEKHFGGAPADLRPGGGQGNHIMFRATVNNLDCMIRLEDGPEQDDYAEVEARVAGMVAATGVPGWNFLGVDSTRSEFPFAWQVIERAAGEDLNALLKAGKLDILACMEKIGGHIARWQSIRSAGFGPFRTETLRREGALSGHHRDYAGYYHTRLDAHLARLVDSEFISREKADDINKLVSESAGLLALTNAAGGCLVHKDLALWNVVGHAPSTITAVIDWDDVISGDPMDDVSLLACFHDGAAIARVLAGYASGRALPPGHEGRFWLHLLRNMLWKSVIRVDAGYFSRDSGFFLIGSGSSGADLRTFTLQRIDSAIRGLREMTPPETLS